jgi:AraC-like DNA-binding protein
LIDPPHLAPPAAVLGTRSAVMTKTELRLGRAAQRLAGSDATVTELCRAVGFESLGSFSSRFRRRFGASPGAWRRIARSEKPYITGLA